MNNTNTQNHREPSWFLIQWIQNLSDNIRLSINNQTVEIDRADENVIEIEVIEIDPEVEVVEINPENHNSDNDSVIIIDDDIISVSDSDVSNPIIGNDVLLNAGIVEMHNHDDEVIIEVPDDFDSNATTEENYQIINDVSESDDGSHEEEEVRDIEMLEDFDSDATTDEIHYDDFENELTINDVFSDDDRTVIFNYDEYARANGLLIERQQDRLVNYSDTESEDSYFEPTINPSDSGITAQPTECPVCKDLLINKQPHFIDPCGHFACISCLKTIFRFGNMHWKCPVCRRQLESKANCKRAFL